MFSICPSLCLLRLVLLVAFPNGRVFSFLEHSTPWILNVTRDHFCVYSFAFWFKNDFLHVKPTRFPACLTVLKMNFKKIFSCEYWEFFKNTYLEELEAATRSVVWEKVFLEISQHSQAKTETCNFINKRLWCRCFPVNFVKFLIITPFLQNTSGQLPLKNICEQLLLHFWKMLCKNILHIITYQRKLLRTQK